MDHSALADRFGLAGRMPPLPPLPPPPVPFQTAAGATAAAPHAAVFLSPSSAGIALAVQQQERMRQSSHSHSAAAAAAASARPPPPRPSVPPSAAETIDLTADDAAMAEQMQRSFDEEAAAATGQQATRPASGSSAASASGAAAFTAADRSEQEARDASLARHLAGAQPLLSPLLSHVSSSTAIAARALEQRAEAGLLTAPSYRRQLRAAIKARSAKKGAPFSKQPQSSEQKAALAAQRETRRRAEREVLLRAEEGRLRDVGSAASGRAGGSNQWASLEGMIETSAEDDSSDAGGGGGEDDDGADVEWAPPASAAAATAASSADAARYDQQQQQQQQARITATQTEATPDPPSSLHAQFAPLPSSTSPPLLPPMHAGSAAAAAAAFALPAAAVGVAAAAAMPWQQAPPATLGSALAAAATAAHSHAGGSAAVTAGQGGEVARADMPGGATMMAAAAAAGSPAARPVQAAAGGAPAASAAAVTANMSVGASSADDASDTDSDIEILDFVAIKTVQARAPASAAAAAAAAAAALSAPYARPNFYPSPSGSPVSGFTPAKQAGGSAAPVSGMRVRTRSFTAANAPHASPPPSPESMRHRALYGAPPDPAAFRPLVAAAPGVAPSGAAAANAKKRSYAATVSAAASSNLRMSKRQRKLEKRKIQLLQQQNRLMEQQLGVPPGALSAGGGATAPAAAAASAAVSHRPGATSVDRRDATYRAKHGKAPSSAAAADASVPYHPSTHVPLCELSSLASDWSGVRHVILLDLDNWVSFFKRLPWSFADDVYLWVFHGSRTVPRIALRCVPFLRLRSLGHIQFTRCGARPDAADFALCLKLGELNQLCDKNIPFTLFSGDRGFDEMLNHIHDRRVQRIDPHHAGTDEEMFGLLKSISDT